jgi:hypothetical protein
MAKAAARSITPSSSHMAFQGYRPGKEAPFLLSLWGDHNGYIDLTRDAALPMALNIITADAIMHGLTDEERKRLRDLADAQPVFGTRVAAAR